MKSLFLEKVIWGLFQLKVHFNEVSELGVSCDGIATINTYWRSWFCLWRCSTFTGMFICLHQSFISCISQNRCSLLIICSDNISRLWFLVSSLVAATHTAELPSWSESLCSKCLAIFSNLRYMWGACVDPVSCSWLSPANCFSTEIGNPCRCYLVSPLSIFTKYDNVLHMHCLEKFCP